MRVKEVLLEVSPKKKFSIRMTQIQFTKIIIDKYIYR